MTNLIGINPIKRTVTTAGTPIKLSPYYVNTTIAFNNNSATEARDTITDSSSLFLVNGFAAGDIITISGSTSNDGEYEIYSIVAGTITLTKIGVLITEVAGDTVTIDSKKGIEVPDGVCVAIKALSTNTDEITLAPSSVRALNTATTNYLSHARLYSDQSKLYQIRNLNQIWMDAVVSGEGVEIDFEK